MRKIRAALLIPTFVLNFGFLTGCASVADGTHQKVFIETTPVTGATCYLKNDKGSWCLNSTPGTVTVHRSFQDLVITAKKSGYQDKTIAVSSKTKGMVFGNLVVGGCIGAGIDCADGAAYDYPDTILIPMEPIGLKPKA